MSKWRINLGISILSHLTHLSFILKEKRELEVAKMSFWKKLFSVEEKFIPQMFEHLQAIYELILPAIHPQDYDYKETLFKTSIKFKTPSRYSEVEMKKLTRLQSVQLTKRTARESFWKASYTEFLALYSNPAIVFAQTDLRKMMEQLQELGEKYSEYESLLKYEETVANIRTVLEEAKQKNNLIEPEVLERSIHLLQQVIYAFEVEHHEKTAEDKRTLLEKLKFESEFMKKH